MSRREVALVACGARKLPSPAAARDLYIGHLFRSCRQWVEAAGLEWAILSAEHGVVLPDRVLAPYDRHLASMPAGERRAWGLRVTHEAYCRFGAARFVVLAGRQYMSALQLDREIHTGGARGEVVDVFARACNELRAQGKRPHVGSIASWLKRDAKTTAGLLQVARALTAARDRRQPEASP